MAGKVYTHRCSCHQLFRGRTAASAHSISLNLTSRVNQKVHKIKKLKKPVSA